MVMRTQIPCYGMHMVQAGTEEPELWLSLCRISFEGCLVLCSSTSRVILQKAGDRPVSPAEHLTTTAAWPRHFLDSALHTEHMLAYPLVRLQLLTVLMVQALQLSGLCGPQVLEICCERKSQGCVRCQMECCRRYDLAVHLLLVTVAAHFGVVVLGGLPRECNCLGSKGLA